MAARLGGRKGLRGPRGPVQAEILLSRDVPLSLRPRPHGPRPQLLDRRRHRPPEAHGRRERPSSHRLGRPGHAGRERGHQARHAPPDLDPRECRPHADAAQAHGHQLRLEPRGQHLPARLLQVEPVDLPAHARARPGLPQGELGQLVLAVPDRPGQRTGRRRRLLALRNARHPKEDGAVVPADHGLRRGAPLRPRRAPEVARARPADAKELDRPEHGRPRPLRARRDLEGDRGLHDAHRYDLRGDVPRRLRRAPDRPRPRRRPQGKGARRLGRPHGRRDAQAPGHRRDRKGRRRHRKEGGQPLHRRARPHLGRQLCPDGLRHRRDHGRAGPRRPRLRVRQGLRHPDPHGHRAAGQGRRAIRRPAGGGLRGARRRRQLRPILGPPLGQGHGRHGEVRGGQGLRPEEHDLPAPRLGHLPPALLGHPHPRDLL